MTDLYKLYTHPASEEERQATLLAILATPTLYQRLLEKYRGMPVPTVEYLGNALGRPPYGLLANVRLEAAAAFIASVEFVGIVRNGHILPPAGGSASEEKLPTNGGEVGVRRGGSGRGAC